MGELAHRRIYQLSVGQQQRVALARAVVFQPDILLLDEPLSALDPQIRQGLRNELARLLRQFRITTIYVTHDQQEAMSLGDQIVVINRGRVEQIGKPADVYTRPANEFVANFMGNANIFDAEIQNGGTGRVLIRLGCGTILMSEHDFHRRWPDVKSGRTRAMVRPHDVSIVTSSEAQMHFHAKEVLYLGDRLRIRGRAEAGGMLDVETSANRIRVSLGDRLSISVDPEDIHFFAADW